MQNSFYYLSAYNWTSPFPYVRKSHFSLIFAPLTSYALSLLAPTALSDHKIYYSNALTLLLLLIIY